MNYVNFAKLCRFYATGSESDTDNLPDSLLLVLANSAKDTLAQEIAKANEDIFGTTYKKNLEADRRAYAVPDEILNNIKSVEAILDGSNQVRLVPFDLNSWKKPTDEDNIRLYFADKKPAYDIYGREIVLYTGDAIIAVTNGLILKAIIYPADFTAFSSTTDMSVDPSEYTFGFPRQFHELLARLVSITYKQGQDRPKKLSEKELVFESDLAKAVASIKNGNLDQSTVGDVPYNDGSQY